MINQPSELHKPLFPLCSPHFAVSHFCRKIARAQNQNCQADYYPFCLVVLGGTERLCASFIVTGEHWSRAVDFSGRLLNFLPITQKLEAKIFHENTVLRTGVSLLQNFCQVLCCKVWNCNNCLRFVSLTAWITIWFENGNYYINISVFVQSCPSLTCVSLH